MQPQISQAQASSRKKPHSIKAGARTGLCLDACESEAAAHPDHSRALPRIRRIRGQLMGVEKMIEERRYCPDILIQTRAIYAAVRSLEATILEAHIRNCVRGAMLSKNSKDTEAKIAELTDLFLRK